MEPKIRPRHPEKVNKPINPIKKKPSWIRSKITNSKEFFLTKTIVNQNNLVTVCQEANCPNITECWSKRHATFLIMGDTCTRACAFCDVITGKPKSLDPFEPYKIANAVNKLNLKPYLPSNKLIQKELEEYVQEILGKLFKIEKIPSKYGIGTSGVMITKLPTKRKTFSKGASVRFLFLFGLGQFGKTL